VLDNAHDIHVAGVVSCSTVDQNFFTANASAHKSCIPGGTAVEPTQNIDRDDEPDHQLSQCFRCHNDYAS
jgi:hypothetical protein